MILVQSTRGSLPCFDEFAGDAVAFDELAALLVAAAFLNFEPDGLIDFRIGALGVAEFLAEEADVEIDLDDAAFCGEFADHVVGHVARVIAEGAAIGMRGDDRRLADGEDVVERFCR